MTKESYILFWLLQMEIFNYVQRVIDRKIIYTFPFGNRVWHLEYDPEEIEPGLECDVRAGRNIVYFGTVEQCLKEIKRAK